MGFGSIGTELRLPNAQLPQCGFVCNTIQSQTPIVCISSSGQSCLSDGRFVNGLELSSCICIPTDNSDTICTTKIQQSQCRIVLIAPLWPQCLWFSEVLQLLVSAPIHLPLFPKLLSQAKGKFQHPNLPLLALHAWELSNNQLEIKSFCKACRICLKIKTKICLENL